MRNNQVSGVRDQGWGEKVIGGRWQVVGKAASTYVLGCLSLVLCLFLMACQPAVPPEGLTVQVQQVNTGRDFEVAGLVGQPEITEQVRLEGIDVPDLAQFPWGEAAKAQLKQLLGNQPVLLETDAEMRDTDGRRLAYVWLNGNLLNEMLVAKGFALAVSHPPNQKYDQRLAHAQDRARALGLGVWDPRQPLRSTPDEFRKQNGKEGGERKDKG
jgi:micrococcal nuclease